MTGSHSEPPPPKRPRGAEIGAWGFGLYAVCRAISIGLDALPLAGAIAQAILVDWGSSRLGLASPHSSVRVAVRRVATGTFAGLGIVAMVIATLWFTRSLEVERVDHLELSVLGIGLLTSGVRAWRDELLLHGLPLHALERTVLSAPSRVLACGLTSAGAALGQSDASAASVATAVLLGLVFGALWQPSTPRSNVLGPWAAHTMVRWSLDTLLLGGLVHARFGEGAWTGGTAGVLAGSAATVALAPLGALALAWTVATMSPRRPRLG